jgi:hypothetical protein
MAFLARHECVACSARTEDMLPNGDAPPPEHCGSPMRRLLGAPAGRVKGSPFVGGPAVPPPTPARPPRRMMGQHFGKDSKVVGRSSGAPVLTGDAGKPSMPRGEARGPKIKHRQWVKRFEDSNAAERDERWRDTCESMTHWQADCLEQSGMDRGDALRKASADQQKITEKARAGYMHPSGVN